MKRLLFVVSLVVCAALASCDDGSSSNGNVSGNTVVGDTARPDDFFAQAIKDVNAISSADDFWVFYNDFEPKLEQYVGENESESVMLQLSVYNETVNAKFAEYYEPVISRLKDIISVISAKQLKGEEVNETDRAELDEAVVEIDKYEYYDNLSPDYQFRYNRIVERLASILFGTGVTG